MTMVDRALADKPVDRNRIYLTGLSSGGGGAWNLLSRFPGRFAAAVTISADAPTPDFNAAHLTSTPVCTFHSRDDDTVPVAEDRDVITKILAENHIPAPSYPAADSNTCMLVYNPAVASAQSFAANVSKQRETTNYLITSPRLDLIYNELPVGGHGIWPNVYASPEVYEWLFAHTLAMPAKPATQSER
jgi:predicted peptidase